MTEADLKKWARELRKAADALDKAEPNGILYQAARRQIDLVSDQMYVAHLEAAAAANAAALRREKAAS